jgi:predicted AAA+ superfamily ATPase
LTYVLDRVLSARLKATKKSVLVLGARQVGKTTLVQSLPLKKAINLADESLYFAYAKDPSQLIREIRAMGKPGLIAIDEVQRVPRLLNSVQLLIDENPSLRFILTGSSARKLKRGQANLLPGRIILEYLDPLMVREIGDSFDLERALQVGCLPGVYLDKEYGADVLETYAMTYLREEVQAEAIVREVGAYSRFLDVAAQASGQRINYTKLASDSEIPKETIRRFFSILEDTLLAFCIKPFGPRQSSRRVSQRDRVLFFDIGVRNALLGLHRHPLSPTERGSLFEQFIILQCAYFNRAMRKGWKLSSYRTETGAEVDLVIETPKAIIGVECKSGKHVRESDLGGLRSLESIAHLPVRKYIVYLGQERQLFSKGEVAIPCRDFLVKEIDRF